MTEHFIWLQSAVGAGNIRANKALEYFGSAEKIFKADCNMRRSAGIFTARELEKLKNTDIRKAYAVIEQCRKSGIDIITLDDDRYPYCLSVIENPPIVLYIKGKLPDFDNTPSICIVGSRNASEYGKKSAYAIARRLALAGFIVVSGGAVGTDCSAHKGALNAGGITALVMGCGINSSYLPENAGLRKTVAERGCLISEYPPETPATKYSFPVRNRILSALSLGTVVTEAGNKSGALITAGYALEHGKDVFVVPRTPGTIEACGSNNLLRDGAKPILDISDIFTEYLSDFPDKINVERAFTAETPKEDKKTDKKINKKLSNLTISKNAEIVYNQLDKHKFYPEEIKDTGLTSAELLAALTELEIEFLIRALPGGRYEIC